MFHFRFLAYTLYSELLRKTLYPKSLTFGEFIVILGSEKRRRFSNPRADVFSPKWEVFFIKDKLMADKLMADHKDGENPVGG